MIGACTSAKARGPARAAASPTIAAMARLVDMALRHAAPERARPAGGSRCFSTNSKGGPTTEQDDRVAGQAVERPPPRRQPPVLAHGQRADVAHPAPVEVAGGGVVDGVGAPPVAVGREGHDPDRPAEPVVGAAPAEERAVPAVVLDHEQADEEARRRHRQQQGQPVAVAEAEPSREPQGRERRRGGGELGQAARGPRLAVRGERPQPVAAVRPDGARAVARRRGGGTGCEGGHGSGAPRAVGGIVAAGPAARGGGFPRPTTLARRGPGRR